MIKAIKIGNYSVSKKGWFIIVFSVFLTGIILGGQITAITLGAAGASFLISAVILFLLWRRFWFAIKKEINRLPVP